MTQYRAVAWFLLGTYFGIASLAGPNYAAFFALGCGFAAGYSYRKRQ